MSAGQNTNLRDHILSWEEAIRDDSEIYSRLARLVAADDGLLELASMVRPGQIPMNMLLAGVQYLLFYNPEVPLAEWYPSLGGTRSAADVEQPFAEYVSANRDQLAALLKSRRVQTNEVARCTFLLPAYNLVNALTGRPIALVEVGTSAGLTQNVDRYSYRYDSAQGPCEVGPGSPVRLTCATGESVPAPARSLPRIEWRSGMDLHPIDVADEDQAKWLRALVWPDQVERHARLEAAIEVAGKYPPTVVGGDVLTVVPELVESAPAEAAVVIQHTWVLNQLSTGERESFYAMLDELAIDRSIYRVSGEALDGAPGTVLELTIHGPHRSTRELASVHYHGAWLKWHA